VAVVANMAVAVACFVVGGSLRSADSTAHEDFLRAAYAVDGSGIKNQASGESGEAAQPELHQVPLLSEPHRSAVSSLWSEPPLLLATCGVIQPCWRHSWE